MNTNRATLTRLRAETAEIERKIAECERSLKRGKRLSPAAKDALDILKKSRMTPAELAKALKIDKHAVMQSLYELKTDRLAYRGRSSYWFAIGLLCETPEARDRFPTKHPRPTKRPDAETSPSRETRWLTHQNEKSR